MPKSRLIELHASGLGVIDSAQVEFGQGFNVITGETGAGKTLLLDALDLCLGGDGASSRHAFSATMRVAAVFDNRDGREVVLTREAGTNGRLRSTLEGAPSSAEALRRVAHDLIVIHGQHDSLSLRHRSEVLAILDASAKIDAGPLDQARAQLREVIRLRDGLGGDVLHRQREVELAEFQIDELEESKIRSSTELTDVLEELTRLTELRDGQSALLQVFDELDGDSDSAVLTQFARVIDCLPAGSTYDDVRTELRGALEQAREGVHGLSRLIDPDRIDPDAIRQLEERATVLRLVARKYGGSLESALVTLDTLRREHSDRIEVSNRLLGLDGEIVLLQSEENRLAHELRLSRTAGANQLTAALRHQLPRVALAHATLRFAVSGDDGSNVQIFFTANPGQPEGPLENLASGGELSRVLLALSLETAHEDVVAVFDEIDAGLGGQVAQQIGDCLLEVGRQQQVLVVTHLASIAAKADHHFVIEKVVHAKATSTLVRQVEGDARVSEIARMLAGDDITAQSRALAQQLLETAS